MLNRLKKFLFPTHKVSNSHVEEALSFERKIEVIAKPVKKKAAKKKAVAKKAPAKKTAAKKPVKKAVKKATKKK